MKEYKIDVDLTPHPLDHEENPYFWMIVVEDEFGSHNTGNCGWAETPEKAFEEALEEFKKFNKGSN